MNLQDAVHCAYFTSRCCIFEFFFSQPIYLKLHLFKDLLSHNLSHKLPWGVRLRRATSAELPVFNENK